MIGYPFTVLNKIDSTNNYAAEKAINGEATHGAAFMALEQTAGRGQRGKTWSSDAGKNIAISVVLDTTEMPVNTQFLLNVAVALATFDLFKKYALDDTSIKWTNDIYWRNRKAAGILIENKFIGKCWKWAIAGIGININQTEFDASIGRKAVSLKQITGKDFNCNLLAEELCAFLDARFEQYKTQRFRPLLKAYNKNLFKKNKYIQLEYQHKTINCILRNADERGNLWIDEAPKLFFTFGEIEWII
jgi:BirA family biotin operon repressor/biotin-[acetyl-CoA-carboxylase] ligase